MHAVRSRIARVAGAVQGVLEHTVYSCVCSALEQAMCTYSSTGIHALHSWAYNLLGRVRFGLGLVWLFE